MKREITKLQYDKVELENRIKEIQQAKEEGEELADVIAERDSLIRQNKEKRKLLNDAAEELLACKVRIERKNERLKK